MSSPPGFVDRGMVRVRIWDLPTRLFHWVLALCVTGLVITGSLGGDAMNLHFRLGYTVIALLIFRLSWGLVGGYWSRFSAFVYGPSTLVRYLKGQSEPKHELGHSPTGALSVFALLAVLLAQVGTGLFSDDEIAFVGPLTRFISNANVSLATGYHKNIGKWLLLALVLLHLLAVLFYAWRKRALVVAMLHGDKVVAANTDVKASRDDWRSRGLAAVLLLLAAAAAYGLASLAAPAF